MDTKRSYMQEADWYEKKVQSLEEEVKSLMDDNLQLIEDKCDLERQVERWKLLVLWAEYYLPSHAWPEYKEMKAKVK